MAPCHADLARRNVHYEPQSETDRQRLQILRGGEDLPAGLRTSQECLRAGRLALIKGRVSNADSDAMCFLMVLKM